MTTKRDIENYISYARKEGLAAGVQKGREEGLADGIEKGAQQANMEAARKMKELGADTNFICQVSGLTPEQVAAL